MAIKKKLTKRQILTELLDVEEKKAKYEQSLQRVYKRGEKLDDIRNDLTEQLKTISYQEIRKAGGNPHEDAPEPILYKGHVFSLVKGRWGEDFKISSVKAIK